MTGERGGEGPAGDGFTAQATEGMVATADRLASGAGLTVLRAGGSAADAAVAAAAVLAVTSPHMCGMGGDLFAVVHEPGRPPAALCAAGRAGSGADALQLRCEGLTRMPHQGDIRSVTVPGCVDGWLELHQRGGRLPLAQVLEPAITYAAAGFPASPFLAETASDIVHLPGADDFREPAMATGGRLRAGAIVRRPGIAAALEAVVASGRQGFYLGAFGNGLIELGGGLFTRGDLARVQAEWTEPLGIRAWGHDLWCPSPPSQAYLTLAGAAVAAELPLPDDPGDPAWPHLLSEAARQVAHDRPRVLHDGADGAALLDPERLTERRARIDPDHRSTTPEPLPLSPGDTTALCAVDRDRMAVCIVQSNASAWGAQIIEPATGEVLHSRGHGFSLEAGHPAEYRPGARPPHTLCPTLVTRPDGGLRAVLGTMGGDGQPQILLQLLARLLASTAPAPVGEAIAAPRWLLGSGWFGTWEGAGPEHITLEHGAPAAWEAGLVERGHRVEHSQIQLDEVFGHAQAVVLVDGEDEDEAGVLHGAADPRTEVGSAAGW